MKYKMTFLLLTLLYIGNIQAQDFGTKWVVKGLEAPESVVYDHTSKQYYVSNVSGQPAEKNGQGFISILSSDGKILVKKWISGLNAPKGLGLYYNQLFIADIDEVIQVDVQEGKIVKRFPAEGATFLNDIEIAVDGAVYVTDTFGGNSIYRIRDSQIELWLKNEALDYPNGLKLVDDSILVSTWGVVTNSETFGTEIPGKLLKVNLETKQITELSKPTGNLDGLEAFKDYFLVSDWISGGLISIDGEGKSQLVKELKPGSADFFYNKSENLILVPQMLDNELIALQLK
ncbi:hypothetical protein [Flagellimonas allohymeniacidonis]|uniref:ATP/GTP-binding protein n=1 Tax=Flagellimonas allohymeniacidonis TaxID=2517819 RepID=A0A4Q8QBB5_9FLAO|nr:hypothetical protein [Allomuricauda hymeniacidonis]TAI47581.1 hypothetical protein EW142_13010 [Allomuricauda hymeniacidonis]